MKDEKAPPRRSLEDLFHHRWSAPAIAKLHALGGGAKFVTLQNALGVSRDSLSRTLNAMIDGGLALRNPGYGHPMRPEYLLSTAGKRLGPICIRIMDQLVRLDLEKIGLKKWSLPVVHSIWNVGGRFNGIRASLTGATPRALASALRDLQDAGLVTRYLVDDDPPRTEYSLTRRGKLLVPLLSELAKLI
jgi:DNA-binding HxlR family transcriptional regulator